MKRDAPTHPKIQKFAALLNIPLPTAVGLLELLWHFTARYAPQGNVGRFSDEEIARGCGWYDFIKWRQRLDVTGQRLDVTGQRLDVTGQRLEQLEVSHFIEVLKICTLVDKSEQHRLIIHDWSDHADDAVRKRLKRNDLQFISCNGYGVEADTDRTTAGHDRKMSATLPDNGGLPEPEPAALTVDQVMNPSPPATPPDTPQRVHTPKNNRPIRKSLIPWLRSELHAYVKGGTGVCRSWEEPDDDICLKILVATHGADSNSIERWLQILYRSQQYPELNYAWFETMAEKRFGKKASDLERAGDNSIISGAAGAV